MCVRARVPTSNCVRLFRRRHAASPATSAYTPSACLYVPVEPSGMPSDSTCPLRPNLHADAGRPVRSVTVLAAGVPTAPHHNRTYSSYLQKRSSRVPMRQYTTKRTRDGVRHIVVFCYGIVDGRRPCHGRPQEPGRTYVVRACLPPRLFLRAIGGCHS